MRAPYSRKLATCLVAVACWLGFPRGTAAADPIEFYKSRIRPLLAAECYACHTATRMGGLRLDERENLVQGGQSGPAIVPGRPEDTLLLRAVSHTDERLKMPPQKKLTEEQIADLRQWIAEGAHFESAAPQQPSAKTADGFWPPERRAFWAFQPPRKPALPEVRNRAWVRSPIDRFILAKLEAKGLAPPPAAARRTLLRRVTFDLTGLPPTPAELQAFLADESPQAFAAVVDRLLASPQYGERWGRHWLDVARYADEDALGLSADPFNNGWRYRDWVIRAFNEDMPYDLFVKAQIAGDLIEGENGNRLKPGVGLFGLGPWYYKIVEPPKAMADQMHDRIDVLTRGFLGLTVACARCHDHKYDPISTRDYYALAGVFFNTKYTEYPLAHKQTVKAYHDVEERIGKLQEEIRQLLDAERKRVAEGLAGETARYLVAAREAVPSAPGALPAVEPVAARHGLDAETLERWVRYLRRADREHPYLNWWEERASASAEPELREAAAKFQSFVHDLIAEYKAIQEYNERVIEESKKSTDPYDIFCKGCRAETRSLARDKYILWRDLFDAPRKTDGDESSGGVFYWPDDKMDRFLTAELQGRVEALRAELKTVKESLPERYPFLHIVTDTEETVDMPLQVRGDPYNLGEMVPRRFLSVLGKPEPVPLQHGSGRLDLAEAIATAGNPLTARVMVNRIWHHLFGAGLVRTPSNFGQVGDRPSHPELLDYLATRFVELGWSVKQLQREILLSAAYAMSSEVSAGMAADPENRLLWRQNRRRLDVESLRDAMLAVAGELDATAGGPTVEWTRENKRRTLYARVSRFRNERLLTLFDFPDPAMTSEKRAATSTPVQRLFFLNSEFIKDRAKALADRLGSEAGDSEASRLERAFELLYSRKPTPAELTEARGFLHEAPAETAWAELAQVMLSSNEFMFLD